MLQYFIVAKCRFEPPFNVYLLRRKTIFNNKVLTIGWTFHLETYIHPPLLEPRPLIG